jgi:hypothetical protein
MNEKDGKKALRILNYLPFIVSIATKTATRKNVDVCSAPT